MYGEIETYHPPDWAVSLSFVPKKRLKLAMTNTPVHPWKVPGVPADFSVSIKRDDLTGCSLSGNKIRKLEFHMADAVERGCSHVITSGGLQSNHCRAVSLCARQLGLTPHLFVRTDITDVDDVGYEANMLLNRLCGAHVYLVPPDYCFETEVDDCMTQLAQQIKSNSGESCHVIPFGGTNKSGMFGFINLFEELRQQGVLKRFDDLVFPCGRRAGTATGLALANHLTGGHLRLHGIALCEMLPDIYTTMDGYLREVGMGHLRSRDLLRVVDGYHDKGVEAESEFIRKVAERTSILLDLTYTAKTALGMVREMTNNPSAFKGRRVLMVHTGGIFGLFDGRIVPQLEQSEEKQPTVQIWRAGNSPV